MDLPLFFHLPLALNFLLPSYFFVNFLLCDFLTPNARALSRARLGNCLFMLLRSYVSVVLHCYIRSRIWNCKQFLINHGQLVGG